MAKFIKHQFSPLYDQDADVVYVHFVEHPSSTHSEMREDGILLDDQDGRLVGLTILEASQRAAAA